MPSKYSRRPDGRYIKQIYIGKDENSKKKYKSIYAKTIAELEMKVTQARLKLHKGIDILANESFAFWGNQWLDIKRDSVGNSQFQNCTSQLKYLTNEFGSFPIAKVTLFDVQRVINELAKYKPDCTAF
ncbi:MAG: hypothetical protein FWG82_05305 [Oscillospiraceae bacterium]|nr:hypothetical protein [Oscillospiraceae bacterium]